MPAPIRFPKMHIAASVANRILNIADGLPSIVAPPVPDPVLPDVALNSDVLNAELATPPGPAELPAESDGAVVDAALNGDSLVGAATDPLVGSLL